MKYCLWVILCCGALCSSAQRVADVNLEKEVTTALRVLNQNSTLRIQQRLVVLDSLFEVAYGNNDFCNQARIHLLKAELYDRQGELDSAVISLLRAETGSSHACDSSLLAHNYCVNCSVQLSLGEFAIADSLSDLAIALWKSAWSQDDAKRSILFDTYANKAIALANLGRINEAEVLFDKLLQEAIQHSDSLYIEKAYTNKGTLAAITGDWTTARQFYELALGSALQRNYNKHIIELYLNLSGIYQDMSDYEKALQYLDLASARTVSKNLYDRRNIENSYALLFAKTGNWKSAFEHQQKFQMLNDSIFNEEKLTTVADVQEKYQSEKRTREIQDLKLSNLNVQLEAEKNKRARNAMIGGAGVLFVTLIFLFARYRIVQLNRNKLRRKNEIIEAERKRSDDLLKNILPEEVAEELKEKGEAQAVQFNLVTVLFTDFKGFTAMSEKVSAQDLVRDLNDCFSAFDHIAEKYGIEKIKTIGDAYMAAGGLPVPNKTHAADVVGAAFEMRNFIADGKARKMAAGLPYFEIRIGIHTGPVVAGIVGVKKFQYDIWGDTVNTASRMESSGEVGRVNISEVTYELIKGDSRFEFESRGLVAAKGKGDLQMYFVEAATH
jgi:class 3 adenylate cyclase